MERATRRRGPLLEGVVEQDTRVLAVAPATLPTQRRQAVEAPLVDGGIVHTDPGQTQPNMTLRTPGTRKGRRAWLAAAVAGVAAAGLAGNLVGRHLRPPRTPPEAVAESYGDGVAVVWEGLGILDHAVVPHVDSPDHDESEACTRLAARYRAEGVPHVALRDGQVLVVDGGASTVC